jgi:hypothetical protein
MMSAVRQHIKSTNHTESQKSRNNPKKKNPSKN